MLFHIQPRDARASPMLTLHTSPGVALGVA
jgi:hypothetical protein